jgi:hypothetical protein
MQTEYEMTSFDALSAFGPELTAEQLHVVDGGAVPLILIALMVTNTALKGTFIYLALSS